MDANPGATWLNKPSSFSIILHAKGKLIFEKKKKRSKINLEDYRET